MVNLAYYDDSDDWLEEFDDVTDKTVVDDNETDCDQTNDYVLMAYHDDSTDNEADIPIPTVNIHSNTTMESNVKKITDVADQNLRTDAENQNSDNSIAPTTQQPTCMARDLAEFLRSDETMSDITSNEDDGKESAARQHDQSVKWIHHVM